MYPEVLNVYEMSEVAYSNGGNFPVSVHTFQPNRSSAFMHGSPGQGVQGMLPVFTFHDGLSPLILPMCPTPPPRFQLCYDTYYICTVCTKQARRSATASRIYESREFFLYIYFWAFFGANASHKMISISYLCFFASISRSYGSRKSANSRTWNYFPWSQVTSLSLSSLPSILLKKEPLLKYIGIKNAVFDRFFF